MNCKFITLLLWLILFGWRVSSWFVIACVGWFVRLRTLMVGWCDLGFSGCGNSGVFAGFRGGFVADRG